MIRGAQFDRRRFLFHCGLAAGAISASRDAIADDELPRVIDEIRSRTLKFVDSLRFPEHSYGHYRYAADMPKPTLYSSTYAAMTRHLYHDLDALTTSQRSEWIEYLQSHQDDDGLFRDPLIYDQGWYKGDPEWCGRRHLTCHVVTALTCLGAVAQKPMRFLDSILKKDGLVRWLEARDWAAQPDFAGNEVLNVGTLLQYARDFQKDQRSAPAVRTLLEWMNTHFLNPETGLWGKLDSTNPQNLSRAVQGAYHFWLLYFYDRIPIPAPERVVDSCLKTQNNVGGFGQGVHGDPLHSSACEDMDSIDPLARLMQSSTYRRNDIRKALGRGLTHVLRTQVADGGFWFQRGRGFSYGHPLLTSGANQGGMFPTWFRTLTLAYLGQVLPESAVGRYPWQFCNCPGIQFWR